jgi:hypothetical protein
MMLTATRLKFLQKLVLDTSRRAESDAAAYFEHNFGMGARLGRGYEYTAMDSEKAKKMLLALGMPLTPESEPMDRADAMVRRGMSEKSGTLAPHASSVAFRIWGGNSGNSGFGVGYQVATPTEVGQIECDCTMVVENFETFRQLHRYGWVTEKIRGQSVLVIFRGDPSYKTDSAQQALEHLSKPVLGFFDFDPSGLFMCSELRGLTKVILPDLKTVRRVAMASKRDDLYYDQVEGFGPSLDKRLQPEIAQAWAVMKEIRVGLPQEWMRDL